jgi:predicted ATPase
VTLLFTDVEGSTRLLHELGSEAYAGALAEHRRVMRTAFARHGGVEVDTQGDAFFAAFPTAAGALDAAREAQEALAQGPIRVRMAIHTGAPRVTDEGYVGPDVHQGARIAAAGHGGQVLLSMPTRGLADVDVVDLGEHHLKDFAQPIQIFQLGTERYPPLKTISNTNLPRPASSFIGREREVSEVVSLVQENRIVTLTGPGGSGKTRLAIEAATELVPEFRNGVFWVSLAAIRDPSLVIETIAQTLGAKDGLDDHIGEKDMLVLVDNLEHVIESAPEIGSLLQICPNLKFLATSREVLRVPGEQAYPIPPLEPQEGMELFLARARAALPSFATSDAVLELCNRLEYLPLPLELAAARVRVLSPEQLVERLSERLDVLKGGRGAEVRQQTLRATIEWSYDLLSKEDRTVLARLAVFVGGCTVEAVEQIAEADLDTLQSLVDKSLVGHTGERFWMLETIREYAAERLEESGEAGELRGRHAQYFLALAEGAEPSLIGPSPEGWLDRLEPELANFRAALDRLETSGETQSTLRLAGALWGLWNLRGHIVEGRRRLVSALHTDTRPTAARAKALNAAAELAIWTGDQEGAQNWAEEALALHRRFGDTWGAAWSGWTLGRAVAEEGEFERARQFMEESVQAFREAGDEHYKLVAGRTLAWIWQELGDDERARALNQDNLLRARALGDKLNQWWSLFYLAGLATRGRQHRDALALLEEGYRVASELGDPGMVDMTLIRIAEVLTLADQAAVAIRLLSFAESIHEEHGFTYPVWFAPMKDDAMSRCHAVLDDAAFAEAWEEGRNLTADEVVMLALESLR